VRSGVALDFEGPEHSVELALGKRLVARTCEHLYAGTDASQAF
jgi:hypothetical protein